MLFEVNRRLAMLYIRHLKTNNRQMPADNTAETDPVTNFVHVDIMASLFVIDEFRQVAFCAFASMAYVSTAPVLLKFIRLMAVFPIRNRNGKHTEIMFCG